MLEDAPGGTAIRSAGLFSLAGVESSGFHAVAADFHVAPAAGLVLAGVQEEPAAGLAGAASELQGPLREQEIYRCLREQPHGGQDPGRRKIFFNFAGTYELPWGFSLSVNSSFISSTPVGAQVNGLVLPGTVASTTTEPLPGIVWDSLNAGTSKAQLAAAVAAYNASAPVAAKLALPASYALSAPIFSQDFRLTKKFTFRERYQLSVTAEMFNAFNISNVIYGSYTLDSAYSTSQAFGQPTARFGQSLGQGGARAVQLGARISF
jgi:hypothetical protein